MHGHQNEIYRKKMQRKTKFIKKIVGVCAARNGNEYVFVKKIFPERKGKKEKYLTVFN